MATLPESSVDSIVCDPPYELTSARPGGRSEATRGKVMGGFMGLKWDATGVAFDPETWRQALRVLKPGGHLLAFGGTRTYHRMVSAIEDAGFEIRDQIGYAFGSGFPKSLDVSKAIDKAAGMEREIVGFRRPDGSGIAGAAAPDASGSHIWTGKLTSAEGITHAAKQWQGWGTALKPAWEPIVVARKPLQGTVAANVLKHGTGALNIDACRVPPTGESRERVGEASQDRRYTKNGATNFAATPGIRGGDPSGRWPANLIHDGSDEVLAAFPDAPGQLVRLRTDGADQGNKVLGALRQVRNTPEVRGDSGSAARFFASFPLEESDVAWSRLYYTAKASQQDRNDGLHTVTKAGRNHHATVKPTALMRYLCRLVNPPGGTVLDPFMGSGSTLKAAELEGFNAIGIEIDPEYVEIAKRRIASDAPLFADIEQEGCGA
jgi:site-specific DNA-methyltransferase (adenine-specific)